MQITTKDSSITKYSAEFNEHYHNINDGALKETLHKHILPSLAFLDPTLKNGNQKILVLDICFGLGFNTLSLISKLKSANFKGIIEIHSPEKDAKLLENLVNHTYPKELDFKILQSLVKTHTFKDENLAVQLHLGDAREILENFSENMFDIIFQDAFSPLKNPLLWTFEYFKMLYKLSKKEVLITTYSHNSRALYSAYLAGFYPFKVRQKEVRDSVILTKDLKVLNIACENILEILPINMEHKIKTNKELCGIYDATHKRGN